eukprot:15359242-Ditylum_brightwellii.AAC.1
MTVNAYTAYLQDHPLPDDDSLDHPPDSDYSPNNDFCNTFEYSTNTDNNTGCLIYPPAPVPATPFSFSQYVYTAEALFLSSGLYACAWAAISPGNAPSALIPPTWVPICLCQPCSTASPIHSHPINSLAPTPPPP